MPQAAYFAGQEARLAALDGLPKSLWMGAITHLFGALESRLPQLRSTLEALGGDGSAPTPGWLSPALAVRIDDIVARQALVDHCRRDAALAETVLRSLIFHLDFVPGYRDRGASEARAFDMALDAFEGDWAARCGSMDELVEVLGDVPDDLKNDRWDALAGLLQSADWQAAVRIRQLIESLPQLSALIRRLGRSVPQPEPARAKVTQTVTVPATQLGESRQHERVPGMSGETRGVRLDDRISRMLPAEAMLLGHPRYRLLWHARRAERSLMCYEDDERLNRARHESVSVPLAVQAPAAAPELAMGPMLICVDTSGSMQGGAEAVAKAVVLEAARHAFASRRPCRVFAFGGTDEVVEMSLSMSVDGVRELARFLGQSFHGGTDICAPIERCLARLEEAEWQCADLLIASDGQFGATAALADRVRSARDTLGLRVQSILIGDRETIGQLELSDDVFWVRDWRRYGLSDGGSPVHSQRLTATYFPGALRSTTNRDATVSGAEASAAVRAGLHRKER